MTPTPLLRQVALAASILTAVYGCDKPSAAVAAAADAAAASAMRDGALDARPPVLYQVFGGRGDPRMLPVAALVDGRIRPLALSGAGWQRFDSLYHRPGTTYTVYQNGRASGTARVTRAMWNEAGEPLYTLPHCRQPTPLVAVDVKAPPPLGFFVEHLATDARIEGGAPPPRAGARRPSGDEGRHGRAVAERVAEAAGLEPAALARLDVQTHAVATRATAQPTLVVTLMNPAPASTPGGTTHLLVLADHGPDGYGPTYSQLVRDGDAAAQYRRYVDHLDLTGDGVDELVLEGWSSGRESFLLILQYEAGRWAEVFRSSASWCRDERAGGR